MKKITKGFLIISICMLSIHLNAQVVALRGGFNLSSFSISNGYGSEYEFTPGFHFGASFDIPLGEMFAVETGLLLTTKGGQQNTSFDEGSYKSTVNILNTEIPVSFKSIFAVGENLDIYVSAGGYLGVALAGVVRYKFEFNGEAETEAQELSFGENELKRLDYGLTFGTGIEVKGFIIGTSYDLGLSNLDGSGWSVMKNRVLKFSIGYRFGWNN